MPSFKPTIPFDIGRALARVSSPVGGLKSILDTLSDSMDEVTGHAHGATGEGSPLASGALDALSVDTAELAAGAVTAPKLGALAVETAKIDALAVTEAKIGALAVTSGKIAAAAVTAAKLEEGAVTHVKIQLTDTNVLALATGAGIELVATPGADKAILVHNVMIVADAVLGAWVEPSAPDDLVVQYAGGADITGAIEAGVLIAADVSMAAYAVVATEITPEPNVGVNLFNTGTNWTGGNAGNTLSVYIAYSVVPTIPFT